MKELLENIQETLKYIETLENGYKASKEDNLKYVNCLQMLRSQLYDRNNCETALTKIIDNALTK